MTMDIVNFSNFYRSMITLFRCSTGEDWQAIMSDLWQKDCGENCSLYGNIIYSKIFTSNRYIGVHHLLYPVRYSDDICHAESLYAGPGSVV